MNRYVIEGLLQDLVYRKKRIIFVGGAESINSGLHDLLLDELHSHRWSHGLERAGRDFIEFRGGGRIEFATLGGRHLEGRRADAWVVLGVPRVPFAKLDPSMRTIQRNAQSNDAEIILLD